MQNVVGGLPVAPDVPQTKSGVDDGSRRSPSDLLADLLIEPGPKAEKTEKPDVETPSLRLHHEDPCDRCEDVSASIPDVMTGITSPDLAPNSTAALLSTVLFCLQVRMNEQRPEKKNRCPCSIGCE